MVRVLIVTYNSIKDIAGCLQNITQSIDIKLEISVIDNNSTDGTVKYVKNKYPQIDIISLNTNSGYAYANNVGIREYLGSTNEPDAFLILNPDLLITTKQISLLFETLKLDDNLAAVSPRVIENSNSSEQNFVRTIFGRKSRESFNGYKKLLLTDMLHGACMVIRADVFKHIGIFDESFFLYGEETEFCYRIYNAGYKLLVNMEVKVDHRKDQPYRAHTIYYIWRNSFLLSKKCFNKRNRVIYMSRRVIILPKVITKYLIIRRFDLISAIFFGLYDGLLGRKYKSNRYFLSL